jgi:MoaA/NifB/PqqE/SkfB family radical SAM enzyme
MKLLRAVKRARLPLTIITNGTALPRVAAELLEIGLDRLIVSLDGPPEVHNAVRGHPRSYQLAAEGIARVLAGRRSAQQPFVQVSCALSVYTQAHLAAFVSAVGRLEVDRIVLNGLIYASAEQAAAQRAALAAAFGVEQCRADVLDNGAQSGVDVPLVCRELAAIRAGPWSDRVIVAPPGVEQHLAAYYAPDAPPFRGQRCTAIHRELWVLPNGDVGACAYIADLAMGNVRTGGVLAAWNSPLYRRFRERLGAGLLPACARCSKLSFVQPPAGF